MKKLGIDTDTSFILAMKIECAGMKFATNICEKITNFILQHSEAILTLGAMIGSYITSKQAYVKYIGAQAISNFLDDAADNQLPRVIIKYVVMPYIDEDTELSSLSGDQLEQHIYDGGTIAGILSATLIGLGSIVLSQIYE